MLIPLGSFLETAAGPLAKKVLTGLGLGVISYSAVTFALEYVLDITKGYYNGLPNLVFNLFGLAGVGEALGLIAGALVYNAAVTNMARIGVIPK